MLNTLMTGSMRNFLRLAAFCAVSVIVTAVFVSGAAYAQAPQEAFLGTYFNDENLTEQVFTRTDARIDFDWAQNAPDPRIEPDTFSVRWEGTWNFSSTGTYQFSATADDGMRVYVDNELVLDRWFDQSATTHEFERSLTSGAHSIKAEYYENGAEAVARVSWRMLGPAPTSVPTGTPTPTPPPSGGPPPAVETRAAINVTQVSAVLRGDLVPNGSATTYHFEYGPVGGSIFVTPDRSAGSGNQGLSVSESVSNLQPEQNYFFRLVATNAGGMTYGTILNFTTTNVPPPQGSAPDVQTRPATNVTQVTAMLRGEVVPNGSPTTYHFEYGPVGGAVIATPDRSAGTGNASIAVSESVSNLIPERNYFFRLIAANAHGTTYGPILNFVTTSVPRPPGSVPDVVTRPATNVTQVSAVLRGELIPNGAETRYHFEYAVVGGQIFRTPDRSAGAGTQAISVSESVNSLGPQTPHYFRLIAENEFGTGYGDILNFVTLGVPPPQGRAPEVQTRPAVNITQTSAVLVGEVIPNGAATSYFFEYGDTSSLGFSTPAQSAGSGTSVVFVTAPISNLRTAVTYYFRLVARNVHGTVNGPILNFETSGMPVPPGSAPLVQTRPAVNITQTSALLVGEVVPNSAATTYFFEYGETSNFGNVTPTRSAGTGNSAITVTVPASNLREATTYFFRLVAENPHGTTHGQILEFLTLGVPQPRGGEPFVQTRPAVNITQTSAVLVGEVVPNGSPTNYFFEFGTSPNLGNSTPTRSAGSGTVAITVTSSLTNLDPQTTYYFRLVAENTHGRTNGPVLNFETSAFPPPPGSAPLVQTRPAVNITQTSAVFVGDLVPNGAPTTYFFEFGTSSNMGNSTQVRSAGSGNASLGVTAPIANLERSTVYYFRLVAENLYGETRGPILNFVTLGDPPLPGGAPSVQTRSATDITQVSVVLRGELVPNGVPTTYHFEYATTGGTLRETQTLNAGSGTGVVPVSASVSDLEPNRVYYFRLIAENIHGTTFGPILSFVTLGIPTPSPVPSQAPTPTPSGSPSPTPTPLPGRAPSIETRPAANVTQTSAVLQGVVNPNGFTTEYFFEYGETISLGNSTPRQTIGAGNATVSVSRAVSDLAANRTHYFRIVAENQFGRTEGSIISFATLPVPVPQGGAPLVQTLAATGISQTSATLEGFVNPNGSPTAYWFEYGSSASLGNSTDRRSAGSGTASIRVSTGIQNLEANTRYYFRVVAENEHGLAQGSILTFTTPGVPGSAPRAETRAARDIGETRATLEGRVNPMGVATSFRFEYGETASLGSQTALQNIGSGTTDLDVSVSISNLRPNTTYYFRIYAENQNGSARGALMSFVTTFGAQGGVPVVQTVSATSVSQTFATLQGDVNPNGVHTTYRFEYGTSPSLGNSTDRQSAGSGNASVRVSAGVSNLESNTRYYFRITAENTYGTAQGSILTFTTSVPAGNAPRAETRQATGVGRTSATLTGEINPMGASTSFRFEYGETTSLGSTTSFESAGSGTSPLSVSVSLSNLRENTTYYFRIYAENREGSSRGQILSFTTELGTGGTNAPAANTSSATNIGQTFATLRGSVNPNGAATTYYFEYGDSQSLGNSTERLSAGSGNSSVSVSVGVSNLEANRTYYFRIVAENQHGTTRGSILSFTSGGAADNAPSVETRSATNIGETSATLQGQMNPQGSSATYWFEYGTSSSFGNTTGFQSAGSGTGWLTVGASVSNLNQNTTYYFRLVAQSSRGTSYGGTLSFTMTGSTQGNAPSVQTNAADTVRETSATLRGQVNPNGGYATAWFEYGINQSSLTFTTNQISVGSGRSFFSVSQSVSDLTSRTLYFVRLVARNEFGTSYGQITSFTTLGTGPSAGTAPIVITRDATGITQNFAFLRGDINPQDGMTTAWFEFGPTSSLGLRTTGQAITSGNAFVSFGTGLPQLLPNSVYYFRAAAQNQFGTSYGTTLILRTSASIVAAPPSAAPTPPTGGPTPSSLASGPLSCLIFLANVDSFELQPGQEFTFTATYRNECSFVLSDASLEIQLPSGTTFLASDAQIAGLSDRSITFALGSVSQNFQSSVSVQGMVKDDASEGASLIFGAILTFMNGDNRLRTVSAYVAGIVHGEGIPATATVIEQFKNLMGNWLFWVVVVFLIFLAFLMRRRGRRIAKKEELELAREPRSQPA